MKFDFSLVLILLSAIILCAWLLLEKRVPSGAFGMRLGGGIEPSDLTARIRIRNPSKKPIFVSKIYCTDGIVLAQYGRRRLGDRAGPESGAIPSLGLDRWIVEAGSCVERIVEVRLPEDAPDRFELAITIAYHLGCTGRTRRVVLRALQSDQDTAHPIRPLQGPGATERELGESLWP